MGGKSGIRFRGVRHGRWQLLPAEKGEGAAVVIPVHAFGHNGLDRRNLSFIGPRIGINRKYLARRIALGAGHATGL